MKRQLANLKKRKTNQNKNNSLVAFTWKFQSEVFRVLRSGQHVRHAELRRDHN